MVPSRVSFTYVVATIPDGKSPVPLPSDYQGGDINVGVIYTSTTNAGTFNSSFAVRPLRSATEAKPLVNLYLSG